MWIYSEFCKTFDVKISMWGPVYLEGHRRPTVLQFVSNAPGLVTAQQKRAWMHFCPLPSCVYKHWFSLSLLFSRLTSPSPLSLSSYGRCFSSFIHLSGYSPVCPCFSCTEKPRTGHNSPGVASSVLSSEEGSAPSTCWQQLQCSTRCHQPPLPHGHTWGCVPWGIRGIAGLQTAALVSINNLLKCQNSWQKCLVFILGLLKTEPRESKQCLVELWIITSISTTPALNLFKSAFKVLGWVIFGFVRIISRQMQTITGKGLYSVCALHVRAVECFSLF